MIELFQVASSLQSLFRKKAWKFCFIGGVALQRWGEPRVTQDIDVTLFTGFKDDEVYIDELLKHYPARIDGIRTFAIEQRVLLLKTKTNIGIDISLGGLPFEEEMIERASDFEFLPGISLCTCSAEDLIVLKAFAAREKDWSDIHTVIVRQRAQLDQSYMLKKLTPLAELKEEPEILARLKKLLGS